MAPGQPFPHQNPPERAAEPGCAGCSVEGCAQHEAEDGATMSSGRFVLASMGVFLFPALLGVTGSLSFGSNPNAQFVGGLGGLVLGMAIAYGVGQLAGREKKETP